MLKKLGTKKNNLTLLVIAILGLLLPVFLGFKSYSLMLCCLIEIYVIAVSGLDLCFGYCGQISMGHAAFYAVGCYTSAILANKFGINPFITTVIGACLAALIGAALAFPASKLVFHFLSMATVAFGEIMYQFLIHSPGKITGNFQGIYAKSYTFFGFELSSYRVWYYFGLAMMALFLLAKWYLVHSKTGRAFTAIRENKDAAEGMGVNVRGYKVMAFATSAFFTAFAGGLYMHLFGYVHPDMFQQKQSVLFLTMLLFGGSGSLVGPVVGVVAIELLIENLRFLQDWQQLIYGVLILIVVILIPGGIWGTLVDAVKTWKAKAAKKTVKKEAAENV